MRDAKENREKKKMSRELLEARSMRKEGLPPKEQTIRKVMKEGMVRKIQKKIMQGKAAEKKNLAKKR